jgi:gamma-glutamyltranspeptidase/glutathione hydrolase
MLKNAAQVRNRITDTSHGIAYYDPTGLEVRDTPGTSHIVTADASGMAVTLTTTVNLLFGSTIMVPETGIIINDEMNGRFTHASTSCFLRFVFLLVIFDTSCRVIQHTRQEPSPPL